MSNQNRRVAPGAGHRCRWCWIAGTATAMAAAVAVMLPATASATPWDDASPSSEGMPGGPLVRQLLGWGMWLGLAACLVVTLYGAATWAGWGSASAGRAVHGKTYVIAGLIGAAIIGLAPTIVSMMFDAGRS